MKNVKKMVLAALFIAIGIVLPLAFHTIPQAGRIFLPMHIPVLLAGLVCGLPFGIICAIVTPLLSSLLTGMPPTPMLPAIICEMIAYSAVASLLMRFTPVKDLFTKSYISLIGAMIVGRVVFGVLNALIFSAGDYSMQIWLGAAVVTALPGIVIQILIIPAIVVALGKMKLVDLRNEA